MTLAPMRFKGVEWRHNPHEITFHCEKQLDERVAPYDKAYVQQTGRRNMLIKGEGELYGADCMEQFERLYALFQGGGCGVLAIPGIGALHAVFEALTLKGVPKEDVLTYGFVFREVMELAAADGQTVCTAAEGETLWDIAYRFQKDIDTLVALNPWVRRPDENLGGKEVALCCA